MNTGYLSLWILIIAVILIVTGWREQVVGHSKLWLVAAAAGFSLMLQHEVVTIQSGLHGIINIHLSIIGVLIVVAAAARGTRQAASLLLCVVSSLLVGIIWGSVRIMYSYDPVLYVFHPTWDGPLIGGLLTAAFTTKVPNQAAIIGAGALAADALAIIWLPDGNPYTIGHLSWWDTCILAYATARAASAGGRLVSIAAVRLRTSLTNNRGGQSPS
ncbi:hypothetical protein ACFO9Q_12160 [Paenibacillus sp. GCM10023252]|uniref:YphA family membrane protein n=1 Tax=Paenibacillus sp. GCM10023252 TaxID=3252649 RepID=UPI00361A2795